jgi:general secretion pathway protein A
MYTAFYGLKEEPFRLTPDPRFLHLAEPHREVLTSLVSGVVRRKGILVATGPVGTGKTTLLHAALHFLSSNSTETGAIASAFLLNPTLSREELIEAVLDEFEVSCTSSSKTRRLAALYEMLLETQRNGGTAVLVIDEAHLLTVELLEEIRLLTNADTHQEKLLQVILSGQPELLPRLRRPELSALKQRIASRAELRALSLPETRVYVAERLHAAGLRTPSPFKSASFEVIQLHTKGVPRLINLLCDRCLMMGFDAKKPQIDSDIVAKAAVAQDLVETAAPVERPDDLSNLKMARTSLDLLIDALKHDRAFARD